MQVCCTGTRCCASRHLNFNFLKQILRFQFSMLFDILATVLTVLYFGLNIKHYDLVPSISTFVNCLLWLRYGILNFNFSMILVNLVGVLCSLFGVYKLSVNSKSNKTAFRNTLVVVALYLIFLRTQIYPVALFYCGLTSSMCTIVMFGSPLAHLKKVIKTKNVALLNKKRILLSFCVSLSWVLVGVELNDAFIVVPNGIGLALSVIQIFIYWIYRGPYRDYRQVN